MSTLKILHKLKKKKNFKNCIKCIKYQILRIKCKIFKLGDTFSKGYHFAIEFENFSEFFKAK